MQQHNKVKLTRVLTTEPPLPPLLPLDLFTIQTYSLAPRLSGEVSVQALDFEVGSLSRLCTPHAPRNPLLSRLDGFGVEETTGNSSGRG